MNKKAESDRVTAETLSIQDRRFLAAVYALSVRFPFDDRVQRDAIPESTDKEALIERLGNDPATVGAEGYFKIEKEYLTPYKRIRTALHPLVRYSAHIRRIAVADSVRCVFAMFLSFASVGLLTFLAGSSQMEFWESVTAFAKDIMYVFWVVVVSAAVFVPAHFIFWFVRGLPAVRSLYRNLVASKSVASLAATVLLESISYASAFLVLLYLDLNYLHSTRHPYLTIPLCTISILICGLASSVRMLPAPLLREIRPFRDVIIGAALVLAAGSALKFESYLGTAPGSLASLTPTSHSLPDDLMPRDVVPEKVADTVIHRDAGETVPFTLERLYTSFAAVVVLLMAGPTRFHYRIAPWNDPG